MAAVTRCAICSTVEDLVDLLERQVSEPEYWDGETINVGGGRDVSLSLLETTALCAEITGITIDVEHSSETRPGDLPLYISDCGRLFERCDWRPQRDATQILTEIDMWIAANERAVRGALLG